MAQKSSAPFRPLLKPRKPVRYVPMRPPDATEQLQRRLSPLPRAGLVLRRVLPRGEESAGANTAYKRLAEPPGNTPTVTFKGSLLGGLQPRSAGTSPVVPAPPPSTQAQEALGHGAGV